MQHGGRDQKIAQGHGAFLERHDGASEPRRFLERAGNSSTSQKRRPGGDGGHRLVRRGGSLWLVQNLSVDRKTESQSKQRARRGPLASRRLGFDEWRKTWADFVRIENGRFLSR